MDYDGTVEVALDAPVEVEDTPVEQEVEQDVEESEEIEETKEEDQNEGVADPLVM